MHEPRLQVRGMTVWRAERRVVDNVDMDVARGQVVCVSGPSGCGKSTLLRGLARLEPTSGNVMLDGSDAASMPFADYRRRVSLVFQESPMFEGTVADNIRFGPALRGESLDDERVRDLLRSLSLEPDMARRDAHELSGGERQRVALARAIANDPDVLLLDEPTSALDPAATDEVLAQIARVAERGLSVVAVLHVAAQARELSDTRFRMKSGRLELEAA
jgi:UDP-glucose/iron transport system ATP-binding protein